MDSIHVFGRLRLLYVFVLVNCLIKANSVDIFENELTIKVKPGTEECFYQKASLGQVLDLEYQVLDADYENIDTKHKMEISFTLYSPKGSNLISDVKKADGIHRHDVQETGDYKFCFSNKFSHFSTKTVYFDVFVDSDDDDDDQWDSPDVTFLPEVLQNDTLSQIKLSINNVRDKLNQIQHFQYQKRSIGIRHQNILEHNHSAINTFSLIIIITMFLVGSVQVIMVRSLFEEKSKLHKIFKLLS